MEAVGGGVRVAPAPTPCTPTPSQPRGGLTRGVSGSSQRLRGFTFGSGNLQAVRALGNSRAEASDPGLQGSLTLASWAQARDGNGHW